MLGPANPSCQLGRATHFAILLLQLCLGLSISHHQTSQFPQASVARAVPNVRMLSHIFPRQTPYSSRALSTLTLENCFCVPSLLCLLHDPSVGFPTWLLLFLRKLDTALPLPWPVTPPHYLPAMVVAVCTPVPGQYKCIIARVSAAPAGGDGCTSGRL